MHAFRVGQRVKLVKSARGFNGLTGKIVSLYAESFNYCMDRHNCAVDWDDGKRSGPSLGWVTHTDQLEPLAPPHQPGSWRVIEQWLPNLRGMHA